MTILRGQSNYLPGCCTDPAPSNMLDYLVEFYHIGKVIRFNVEFLFLASFGQCSITHISFYCS